MESLTEDLLFDILIRLTSRDIHNSARLVCRKWAHLTRSRDFIRLHLHRAATGLLLHIVPHDLIFISGSQGRVETSRALYKSGPPILGISHGLVLVKAPFNPCSLRIMNPETTETLDLPPHFGHCTLGSCLTYAAASMAYKVVQVCIKSVRNMRAFKCSIH
ncbi:Unknown protein [Striga hermonthica]|uniref:F-box domain-containing protein n=1 Tax=Striga hermonthica TaxID=68872 RepID=A0A9N7N427_STRHE|nr:Unknown protein [Striga hermonthica]